jgi:hypothetical protein
VTGTRARYVEAFERITEGSFARYLADDVVGTDGAEAARPASQTDAGSAP